MSRREQAPQPEVFFNVSSGQLYVGRIAVDEAIDQYHDPQDIVPLGEALVNLSLLPSNHTVRDLGRTKWTVEQATGYGIWISTVLKTVQPKAHVTEVTLENGFRLGLGPGQKALTGHFDHKLWKYQDAIGEQNGYARGRFSAWTTGDFKEYAKQVAHATHRKPKTEDFQRWFEKGRGPSPAYIRRRIGGIDTLQELIGYPNILDWTESDYIDYGVKVLRANEGKKPTRDVFDALSKKKRGPSTRSIVNHFDKLTKFQAQIQEEYQMQIEMEALELKQKVNDIQKKLETGKLPESLIKMREQMDDREFVCFVSKYMLVSAMESGMTPNDKLKLAGSQPDSIIANLVRTSDGRLKPGHVEVTASEMGIFDDIWPMDDYMEYLKVT